MNMDASAQLRPYAQLERASASVYLNFLKVAAFHKVKFWLADPHGFALPGSDLHDVIHCRPSRKSKHGDTIPGRFDTVLVRVANARNKDIYRKSLLLGDAFRSSLTVQVLLGWCVAQVCHGIVFKVPEKALADLHLYFGKSLNPLKPLKKFLRCG